MIGPLGFQEMMVIMVLALMLFGPRKLPQIGKTLGKSLAEFRRTSNELKNTLEREVQMEEFRAARSEVKGFGQDLREGLAGEGEPSPQKPETPEPPDEGATASEEESSPNSSPNGASSPRPDPEN